jgi:hypothetical protein
MEKHPHPFDEFLKEALKGHQLAPPEEAKKAFLKEASAIIPARKGWLKWYYIPILVILISGTIAFIYFRDNIDPGTSSENVAESIKSAQNTNPDVNPTAISSSPTTSIPASKANNEPVMASLSAPAETRIISDSQTVSYVPELSVDNTSDITRPEIVANVIPNEPVAPEPTYNTISSQSENLNSATTTSRMEMDSLAASPGPGADTTNMIQMASDMPSSNSPADNPEPGNAAKEKPSLYVAASAYYLPEWMFNTIEGDKYVNNYGIECIFYRGLVSIRTGAGISMSKGITENAVSYNEYLGTYNKLDSVTFIFNESSHDFLPNLHMSEEKVWDSSTKLDSTSVLKRYTYLQIPLVLGFDFWQQGRFTIGVRVGTIMSVMLNSKQLSGVYDPGENIVTGIARLSPDHVSINWQAIGGISGSARLTKSIFFEIEPQAKYYYQSIYEDYGSAKKPWSVGLRTAFIYKF